MFSFIRKVILRYMSDTVNFRQESKYLKGWIKQLQVWW